MTGRQHANLRMSLLILICSLTLIELSCKVFLSSRICFVSMLEVIWSGGKLHNTKLVLVQSIIQYSITPRITYTSLYSHSPHLTSPHHSHVISRTNTKLTATNPHPMPPSLPRHSIHPITPTISSSMPQLASTARPLFEILKAREGDRRWH
ncbi:hypothetical protein B0J14DRAFT_180355 [Halenospora varia]|nr:hypothetical protein B0J14DRAFT_180355 [Halenospora varia]